MVDEGAYFWITFTFTQLFKVNQNPNSKEFWTLLTLTGKLPQSLILVNNPNFSDGYVTLQEYMGFMINKETENVRSSEDIEMAFRALSKELRPYVTAEELYAVSPTLCDYFTFAVFRT
jgi:Ca2+-binding EF-hand superfamily protein